jgi:hypothetical protein
MTDYQDTLSDLAVQHRAELVELGLDAERIARQSGQPLVWRSPLPEPSGYLLSCVRRCLNLSETQLSDNGAMVLLAQMLSEMGYGYP